MWRDPPQIVQNLKVLSLLSRTLAGIVMSVRLGLSSNVSKYYLFTPYGMVNEVYSTIGGIC